MGAMAAMGDVVRSRAAALMLCLGSLAFAQEPVDALQPSIKGEPVRVYEEAHELRVSGDLTAAETLLTKAVRRWPNYYRAQYELGLVLSQLGKYDDAIARLKVAQDIGNREGIDTAALLNSLGWTYYLSGSYAQAEATLKIALSASRQSATLDTPKVLNNLGMVYLTKGDFELSKQYFGEAAQVFNSDFANQSLESITRIEEQLKKR